MKNKLISLLFLAAFAVSALASCSSDSGQGGASNGGASDGECQHPLCTEWSSNETTHWHATECEHGEFRSEPISHVDADEDGFCDECNYEVGHEHTYASEWQSDVYEHWRTANCSHTVNVDGPYNHADEDANGECDTCKAHVHIVDATGRCTLCNTQVKVVDPSDIGQVVAAVYGGHVRVNGGKIISNFIGRYAGGIQSENRTQIIDYLIGVRSIYYSIASATEVQGSDRDGETYEANTSDYTEKWLNREADNSIFSVYRKTANGVAGNIEQDVANENNLFGHYYSVSTLANGYGAEGILKALYDKSQDKYSSDFVVEEADGNYKFSFKYTAINTTNTSDGQGNALGLVTNVNHFVVDVEFSYDADYALTSLSIKCDCYTNDAGSNLGGEFDVDNVDLEYDAQTGTVLLLENAQADTYTITVEQTAGKRTYVNEYTRDYFAPNGFLVYSDVECKNLCPDTITVSLSGADKFARFYLQDKDGQKFTTETAVGLQWTTSDAEGLSDKIGTAGAFSWQSSQVRFLAKAVGTYTVTIYYQGVTKTFTVVVTE